MPTRPAGELDPNLCPIQRQQRARPRFVAAAAKSNLTLSRALPDHARADIRELSAFKEFASHFHADDESRP